MDYLQLVLFALTGVAFAFSAKMVSALGPYNRMGRATVAAVLYVVAGVAACITVIWWQAIILGKGGFWTIQNYFPFPGVWYTLMVWAVQVFVSCLLWKGMKRGSDRFWRQYADR